VLRNPTIDLDVSDIEVFGPTKEGSADPRARRRRTIPQGQLPLAPGGQLDHVWAVSFIVTNIPADRGQSPPPNDPGPERPNTGSDGSAPTASQRSTSRRASAGATRS